MYAVFASGGKQHRVEVGMLIDIEKLDASVGEIVNFSDVLIISHANFALTSSATFEGTSS